MTANTTTQWKQDPELPGYMLDADGKFVAAFCSCGEDDTPSLPTEHEQACLTRSILAVNNHEQLVAALTSLLATARVIQATNQELRNQGVKACGFSPEVIEQAITALDRVEADKLALQAETDNLRDSGKIDS